MKILFVCTGNICRSPTAEGVLRHRLEALGLAGRVEIASAAISDEETGNPIDPRAVRAAAARGYRFAARQARQITPAALADYDLILAMDRGHERALRRLAPTAGERIRLLLDYAPETGVREVPDPWYGDARDFDHALDLIEAGIDGLLRELQARLG